MYYFGFEIRKIKDKYVWGFEFGGEQEKHPTLKSCKQSIRRYATDCAC